MNNIFEEENRILKNQIKHRDIEIDNLKRKIGFTRYSYNKQIADLQLDIEELETEHNMSLKHFNESYAHVIRDNRYFKRVIDDQKIQIDDLKIKIWSIIFALEFHNAFFRYDFNKEIPFMKSKYDIDSNISYITNQIISQRNEIDNLKSEKKNYFFFGILTFIIFCFFCNLLTTLYSFVTSFLNSNLAS